MITTAKNKMFGELMRQFRMYAILAMMKAYEAGYTVDDIRLIETRGPWQSKSGGLLEVLFAMSRDEVARFLDYENPEFDKIQRESGHDIRGLRSYMVSNIRRDSLGANEWHRAKTECMMALSGAVIWHCTDFNGGEREITVDGTTAVITPPGILHTYQALEDNTKLQVVCNTLFIPEDPLTHDNYTRDLFEEMRSK